MTNQNTATINSINEIIHGVAGLNTDNTMFVIDEGLYPGYFMVNNTYVVTDAGLCREIDDCSHRHGGTGTTPEQRQHLKAAFDKLIFPPSSI